MHSVIGAISVTVFSEFGTPEGGRTPYFFQQIAWTLTLIPKKLIDIPNR
jgi:hypothetical protein